MKFWFYLFFASGAFAQDVKIIQVNNPTVSLPTVLLSRGSEAGLEDGDVIQSFRYRSDRYSEKIYTGNLKVLRTHTGSAIAQVTESGTDLSRAMFVKFPGVMAGDFVEHKPTDLLLGLQILPAVNIEYRDLFIDPKAKPTTFELTDQGKQQLRQQLESFMSAKIEKLMVYGYTDHRGSAEDLQTESYQRALTIRQFLINECGFDENRVIAMGHGENNPAKADFEPGFREANRRIEIKAL